MTKKEFIDHYEIADAIPIDPSRRALPAEAFSAAIAEFLENRFYGAVRVSVDTVSAQSILICAEYAAYFFKALLTEIYGRVLLNVKIRSDENKLILLIYADSELPIGESEMRGLIRTARNAGFEIKPESGGLKLTVAFSPAAIRRIYAVSVMDGRRVMLGKMVEIFYQGERLSADPPPPVSMREPMKKKVSKNKKIAKNKTAK